MGAIESKIRKFGEYRLPSGNYIEQPYPDDDKYYLRDGKDNHVIAVSDKLSDVIELPEED